MRMLKQAVLTAGLFLIALIALNLVRMRLTPAQAPQPGTGESARSGDTNCDGKIDITDPIIVLNWLFGDGPEPCAIAQADTCCESLQEEVASLRATVESLAARIPGPESIVSIRTPFVFSSPGTRIVVEVPAGKRLIVTYLDMVLTQTGEGNKETFVSVLENTSTELPTGVGTWPSGVVLPVGASLGVSATGAGTRYQVIMNGYMIPE